LALILDVLLLVFSLWLLGIVVPSIWLGELANEFGKANALRTATALMWVAAIVGLWLFCALIWSTTKNRTLGRRFFLINAVHDERRRIRFFSTALWLEIAVFNALPLMSVIAVVVSIPLTAMGDYTRRATVSSAISNMKPIMVEITKQGCQASSRPTPNKQIAFVEVMDAGSGRCTITMTFASMTYYRTKGLSGEKIKWTSDQNGQWICFSDMLRQWLPHDCSGSSLPQVWHRHSRYTWLHKPHPHP
jgi:uncharacterized RDD family membrane protein YckC